MTENHPLEPFLPEGSRILFLGSFPPPRGRWSMDFFYPNFINDFWRIMGLIFSGDRNAFVEPGEKKFNKDRIVDFCTKQRLAFFDTASAVQRLKGNASDKFLEVVEPTDVGAILSQIPLCKDIAVTGQKALDTLAGRYSCPVPAIGTYESVSIDGYPVRLWRMPSTSRAYPLSLEKKADCYRKLFFL
ncbi:MAG: uracil-DNA glycosylase family protein [Bacteroidales bacterium]|nr:uracil-DNA glycosylase family protein [Bacteroidales bacterium]